MNRYIKESEHEMNDSDESYLDSNQNVGQLPQAFTAGRHKNSVLTASGNGKLKESNISLDSSK